MSYNPYGGYAAYDPAVAAAQNHIYSQVAALQEQKRAEAAAKEASAAAELNKQSALKNQLLQQKLKMMQQMQKKTPAAAAPSAASSVSKASLFTIDDDDGVAVKVDPRRPVQTTNNTRPAGLSPAIKPEAMQQSAANAPPDLALAATTSIRVPMPSAPSDPEVCRAIQNLVEFISRQGLAFEATVRGRSAANPLFAWLCDPQLKDGNEHRFYQLTLQRRGIVTEHNRGVEFVESAVIGVAATAPAITASAPVPSAAQPAAEPDALSQLRRPPPPAASTSPQHAEHSVAPYDHQAAAASAYTHHAAPQIYPQQSPQHWQQQYHQQPLQPHPPQQQPYHAPQQHPQQAYQQPAPGYYPQQQPHPSYESHPSQYQQQSTYGSSYAATGYAAQPASSHAHPQQPPHPQAQVYYSQSHAPHPSYPPQPLQPSHSQHPHAYDPSTHTAAAYSVSVAASYAHAPTVVAAAPAPPVFVPLAAVLASTGQAAPTPAAPPAASAAPPASAPAAPAVLPKRSRFTEDDDADLTHKRGASSSSAAASASAHPLASSSASRSSVRRSSRSRSPRSSHDRARRSRSRSRSGERGGHRRSSRSRSRSRDRHHEHSHHSDRGHSRRSESREREDRGAGSSARTAAVKRRDRSESPESSRPSFGSASAGSSVLRAMDEYYKQLSSRDSAQDENRSAAEIRAAEVDDLSAPLSSRGARSCFPNLHSHRSLADAASESSTGRALDSSNVGHRMLQRMGWSEGTGLGKQRNGRIEPVQAKQRKAGVGIGLSTQPAEQVQPGDDAFEIFKKSKIAAYKGRPNPLNNPRREY